MGIRRVGVGLAFAGTMLAAGCGSKAEQAASPSVVPPEATIAAVGGTVLAAEAPVTVVVAPAPTLAPAVEAAAPPVAEAAPTDDCNTCIEFLGDSNLAALADPNTTDLLEKLTAQGWTDIKIEAKCARPLSTEDGHYKDTCDGPEVSTDQLSGQSKLKEDAPYIAKAGAIVTLLGSNEWDRSEATLTAEMQIYQQRVMEINPNIKSYWVTTFLDADDPADPNDIAQPYQHINNAIKQSGAIVIDFGAEAQPYFSPTYQYGLHPNEEGLDREAELVAAAVGSPVAG